MPVESLPVSSHVPSVLFLPPEAVLAYADELHPMTPEGWIVTERPWWLCDPQRTAAVLATAEHLHRLREFDARTRLLRTEIRQLKEREAVYRKFNWAGALLVSYQETVLARQAAEEALRLLYSERQLYLLEKMARPGLGQ